MGRVTRTRGNISTKSRRNFLVASGSRPDESASAEFELENLISHHQPWNRRHRLLLATTISSTHTSSTSHHADLR